MTELVLKERLRLAFDNVAIPSPDELPADFRAVAGGKHWATLSTVSLFLHRETLAVLPPRAFVAYIAGYMAGGLVDGPYETDLLACARDALTPERQALLDDAQRAAVALFCEYATKRTTETDARDYARRRSARQIPRARP